MSLLQKASCKKDMEKMINLLPSNHDNYVPTFQGSPADYEKAIVAAKEAWEVWAEVCF